MTDLNETLYVKRGRRYTPWGHASYSADVMRVGTYRLVYCPESGHRRYTTEVTPQSAARVAALADAQFVMEQAIFERAKARPSTGPKPNTPAQQRLIQEFRDDMAATGALVPDYWTHGTAYEIAKAGVDALFKHLAMSEFSPATQAVIEAAMDALPKAPDEDVLIDHVLAAALRALAVRIQGADNVRQDILDIAEELEQFDD